MLSSKRILLGEAERRLEELKQQDGESPTKRLPAALRSHNVFGKYVRQTETGKKLRFRQGPRVQNEAQYDGKSYLISTSDLGISAGPRLQAAF